MCDKMVIPAYISKIVKKDPFLRFQMRAKEMFNWIINCGTIIFPVDHCITRLLFKLFSDFFTAFRPVSQGRVPYENI